MKSIDKKAVKTLSEAFQALPDNKKELLPSGTQRQTMTGIL